MTGNTKDHWESVYRKTDHTEVGWFQPHPRTSLNLIAETGVGQHSSIIDAGGGASRLVDDLLDRGFQDLTVLDISQIALQAARARLGQRADLVTWIEEDIISFAPKRRFDLWHDRAVFHFLTKTADRERYVQAVSRSLSPGGHLVIGVFDLAGPKMCSGLDVTRYSATSLSAAFGDDFELRQAANETHTTPGSEEQEYLFCRFQRAISMLRGSRLVKRPVKTVTEALSKKETRNGDL
jgi:SAM-dependent methyltransferase